MATTDSLGLTLIEQSQAQKEVTANEGFVALDAAIAGRLALTTTGGTTTLTATQARSAILRFSGTLASNASIVVPAKSKLWTVRNDCTGAYTLTVKTSAGTGIVCAQAKTTIVYCDGTNVLQVDSAADSSLTARVEALEVPQPYDIGCFYPGAPTASALMLRLPAVRAVTIADDFSGSQASAATGATASTVLTVKKNGSSVGTITFAAAGTTGTFATSGGALSLAIGDVLTIEAPASADATLADIGIMLKGTR